MRQYILGAFGMALGMAMVVKNEWFFRQLGRIDWAEEHLASSGGSRAAYKLLGLLAIFLSLLALTGQFESLGGNVLKKIFVH